MRVVVVGSGPVGSVLATALARRGHEMHLVDRDPGPPSDGTWERRGVVQFRHPHFFRGDVRNGLLTHAQQAWDAVTKAGGRPGLPPGMPEELTALACRRSVFETAVWRVVSETPGITRHVGTAERVLVERGRVTGVVVDGRSLEADLVVDASGRAGHLGDDLRPPVEGGLCGMSYTSRMYAPRPGATPVELSFPSGAEHDGYLCIVFPQDADTLSVLIVRDSDDEGLSLLKHEECYEAAVAAIPHFAPYVDPDVYEPITPAMPGGGLTNTFRGQAAVPGLVAVGDSVSTTNPSAGRGIALGLRQVDELLRLLDEGELDGLGPAMDAWAEEAIRPWFEDHVHWDASLRERWAGADLDVEAPLPSDVICAAAQEDPSMMAVVGPYFGMLIGPRELRAAEEQARAVLRSGWRPPRAEGPSRSELADLVAGVYAGR